MSTNCYDDKKSPCFKVKRGQAAFTSLPLQMKSLFPFSNLSRCVIYTRAERRKNRRGRIPDSHKNHPYKNTCIESLIFLCRYNLTNAIIMCRPRFLPPLHVANLVLPAV